MKDDLDTQEIQTSLDGQHEGLVYREFYPDISNACLSFISECIRTRPQLPHVGSPVSSAQRHIAAITFQHVSALVIFIYVQYLYP